MPVDEALIADWVKARSLARALPLPVADHGGWRVETGSPDELRRYIFAHPVDGLKALGEEITQPSVVLKLCAPPDVLRAMLPARWALDPVSYVMRIDGDMPSTPLPPAGYRLIQTTTTDVAKVRFLTESGDVAANGYAAECDGAFIYDRIVVDEAHRRRGLGRSLILALAATKRDPRSKSILIATAAGRALYETLGWTNVSDYSTAVIRP